MLVLGPSAGLALSEASFLKGKKEGILSGILSFCMSRSNMILYEELAVKYRLFTFCLLKGCYLVVGREAVEGPHERSLSSRKGS